MKQQWSKPFRYLMGSVLLLALVGLFYYAREALKPVVVAAFIAYLVNPAVMLLTRNTRLKRRTAVNLVYFTVIALLIAVPATITPLFFDELKGVAQDLMNLFHQTQILLSKPVELAGFSLDLTQLGAGLTSLRSAFVAPVPADAFLLLESTSRGVVWFMVIIVLVYLFLSEWPNIRNWIIKLAPEPYHDEAEELYGQIRGVWMAYLRGQLLLMLIVGIVFTVVWAIIGIPGALVLGVLAGFFTLIPDVGPAVAVLLAMGVTLLEGSRWITLSNAWVTLIVLIVYLILINIKNLWLRPVIMGRMVNMHEGLIFVAILIATMLSGILGALLVVPVLASVIIVVNYLIKRIEGQTLFPSVAPQLYHNDEEIPQAKHFKNVHRQLVRKKINRN
jgi:predicted PurR-regulated permease PerM